jgi:hypothetical protein
MMTKEEMLNRLREHPLFKAALRSVDAEQAKKIAATTESFLMQAIDGLIPMINQAQDPKQAAAAREVLNDPKPVVTGSKD